MTTRSDIHALVDELADAQLDEARARLEPLRANDPLLKRVNEAPFDDEPFTEEEQRAADKASRAIDRGEWISLSEFEESLGDEHTA